MVHDELRQIPMVTDVATFRIFQHIGVKGKLKMVSCSIDDTADGVVCAECYVNAGAKALINGYISLFNNIPVSITGVSGDPDKVTWQGNINVGPSSAVQGTFYATVGSKVELRYVVEVED